jgi:hypothetical protein
MYVMQQMSSLWREQCRTKSLLKNNLHLQLRETQPLLPCAIAPWRYIVLETYTLQKALEDNEPVDRITQLLQGLSDNVNITEELYLKTGLSKLLLEFEERGSRKVSNLAKKTVAAWTAIIEKQEAENAQNVLGRL